MTSSRVARARQSEQIAAEYARLLFPDAERVPASLPGRDILNTPGVAFEVKARRGLDLPAWLRQAGMRTDAEVDVPVLVVRPDGYGPARVQDWAFITTYGHGLYLLHEAGYGERKDS